MSQIFTIQNDTIIIDKIALKEVAGDINHTGNLTTKSITVDTLTVKNLVAENNKSSGSGEWTANLEADITGKGLSWTHGNGSYRLVYRDGGRIWSDADLDLKTGQSYKIDNVAVLSEGALGSSITKSNLKQIGTLNNLTVLGDSSIGQFAFFSSNLGRFGINTENPNGPLSIVENDVEFVAGSSRIGSADVGTYSNSDLNIVTDNTARIIVKNDGNIIFGNEQSKTANVTIYGTLNVETIISDTRIDRYSSLEFKSTKDNSIYNKGLMWTGTGIDRHLVMASNPDRLWTTESFDLAAGQSYYVNKKLVLSETAIGESVVTSNLTKLGRLESLEVSGPVTFNNSFTVSTATLKSAVFNDRLNNLNINSTGLSSTNNISVSVSSSEVLYADVHQINIGNKDNVRRPVKVYGPLSIGVNNPDPAFDLTVKGNVSFNDKKFITGNVAPTQGTFNKGDICWNNQPQSGSYIGWVCVTEGAPGIWMPFGLIATQ
jgi:hypothetical protein